MVDQLLSVVTGKGIIVLKKNGLLGANLLAVTAINTAKHIDFKILRSLFDVLARFFFIRNLSRSNPYGFGWAYEFAKLTGNAFLSTIGVFNQSGNSTITLRYYGLFFRVLESDLLFEEVGESRFQPSRNLRQVSAFRQRQGFSFKYNSFGHIYQELRADWSIQVMRIT